MIYLIILIASFLIGFNFSVISGTLIFLDETFLNTSFQQEIVVGSLLIGSFIGLLFVASFIDWFGRRNSLVISYALYFSGAVLFSLSDTIDGLIVGRLLSGVAIGASSVVAPMFLAEISQKDKRGGIVSLHQLLITTGILFGYLSNYLIDESGAWRSPYAASAFIAAIGLFGAVMSKKFHFTHEPTRKTDILMTFGPEIKKPLILGILLASLQQVTGINAIIYYAPSLLLQEGIASRDIALFASVGIGVVNFIMTIFAIYFVDRLGRKPLLVYGSVGMILGLILSLFGYFEMGTLLYIAAFATSMGPVVWVYLAEIYPEKFRGRLMTIATFFNLFFNAVVAFTTLDLIRLVGVSGLYGIFIFFLIISIAFTLRFLPETQGKSLEEIENSFKKI
ncbi:MAG: MFS transporter [Verrucomicrobia bacterium]|nr:MFS transporter [Verrucomicrobiota bacterium]NDE62768.1 MFS transporter [Chlamydiota bacterium]